MRGEVRAIAPLYTDLIYSGFDALPELGEEVYTRAFDLQLGGGAAAIPIMLSRMGLAARLGTFLGSDAISRLAASLLEENGLKQYENLYRGEGRPVVVSTVFSYGGDRSFLSFGDEITQADLADESCYAFLKGAAIAFAPQGRPEVVKKLHADGTVLLYDIGWTQRYVAAAEKRSGEQVLSHRDLDPKNVLWDGMEPFLIDWEAAGYVNPERELIEVVNYWACNQRGRLDREKFRALLAAYQMNRPLLHTDWPAVLDSGYGGMLEWLLYNMKRSLGIECSSQEERRLGTAQVRGTLHALDAYERKTALLLEWLREDCDA